MTLFIKLKGHPLINVAHIVSVERDADSDIPRIFINLTTRDRYQVQMDYDSFCRQLQTFLQQANVQIGITI